MRFLSSRTRETYDQILIGLHGCMPALEQFPTRRVERDSRISSDLSSSCVLAKEPACMAQALSLDLRRRVVEAIEAE